MSHGLNGRTIRSCWHGHDASLPQRGLVRQIALSRRSPIAPCLVAFACRRLVIGFLCGGGCDRLPAKLRTHRRLRVHRLMWSGAPTRSWPDLAFPYAYLAYPRIFRATAVQMCSGTTPSQCSPLLPSSMHCSLASHASNPALSSVCRQDCFGDP